MISNIKAKIVSLNGEEIVPDGGVDNGLIERIEELLVKAKNGAINGLAWVEIGRDNNFRTNWWIQPRRRDGHTLMAGVVTLQYRIVENLAIPADE